MNNAVFGKCMENVRNRIHVDIIKEEKNSLRSVLPKLHLKDPRRFEKICMQEEKCREYCAQRTIFPEPDTKLRYMVFYMVLGVEINVRNIEDNWSLD